MRKKGTIIILCLFALFCMSLASACTDKNAVAIEGFEVEQTIEVEYGAYVEVEKPFVTDTNGWLLESWTSVTDKEGNYVTVTDGKFRADDADGYTITYIVRDSSDKIYEKTTSVIVNGSAENLTTIDVVYEQFVKLNETIEINATCSNANAVLEYSVVKKSNDMPVDLTENTFVLTQSGMYTVNVKEKDGKAEYSYTLFAEEDLKDGEIEVFNASWEEKEELINTKRSSWSVTTTEECGILDPYGREASFATFTTHKEYIGLYINPRENLSYYEQLAAEGYTTVSTWIYIEASKPHISVIWADPGHGMYQKEGPDLYPGTWIEYTTYLSRPTSITGRDFVRLYQYWDDQSMSFLSVDNTYVWNPWGGGDTITFYITDMYATKPATITTATEVETQKTVGDTIDVTSLFTADCELDYCVTYRDKTIAISNPTAYKFLGNGSYKITAHPKQPNYRGSASLEFDVTDTHSVSGTPLIKELKDGSVDVSFAELNFAFNETDGITPTLNGYSVYYNGEKIACEDREFTATQAGMYTVESEGRYTVDGTEYVSYHSLTVDVFTQETKYKIIDETNLLGLSVYTSWDANPKVAYKEYTVAGRTDEMIYANSNAQSLSVYGKPFYSKHYYEWLLSEKADAEIILDLYLSSSASSMSVRGLFTAYNTSTSIPTKDWQRLSIDLQTFIDEYDTVTNTYAAYKKINDAGGRPRQGNDGTGALFLTTGDQYKRYVYMDIHFGEEATAGTATLNTNSEILLDTDNDLNSVLDIKLDGLQAQILTAEVQFNGEWIALEKAIFNPAWSGAYPLRLSVETPDGLLYKAIETTLEVGNGAEFESIEDDTVYTLVGDNDFNVVELLGHDADYDYELEIWRDTGSLSVAKGVEFDGENIKGDTLGLGSYFVKVYAVRGESEFSKILCYSFYLDRFESSANELVWIDEFTTENYESKIVTHYDWSSSTGSKKAFSVTTEIPEGGVAGNYLYFQQNEARQDLRIKISPTYSKSYYQKLLDSGKKYNVKFDVYMLNQNSESTRTQILPNVWRLNDSNVMGFGNASSKVALGQWFTVSYDLQTLVDKWDTKWLFGSVLSKTDYLNFYLGNVRLEEAPMLFTEFTTTNYEDVIKAYVGSTEKDPSTTNVTVVDGSTITDISGVSDGLYVKYNQGAARSNINLSFTTAYEKSYYQALLDSGKKYKVTFDIYAWDKTDGLTQALYVRKWFTDSEGTSKYGQTSYAIERKTWYTIELDLETLITNCWEAPQFGLHRWQAGSYADSYFRFILGNIQLVEGEASDAPIAKA